MTASLLIRGNPGRSRRRLVIRSFGEADVDAMKTRGPSLWLVRVSTTTTFPRAGKEKQNTSSFSRLSITF